ncbi:MAG: Asp-tRNA(Asn)/Glu-tRNA(Gln) amidotransferase subunit GatA, partial [Hyphomicrobiaceae bacterium]
MTELTKLTLAEARDGLAKGDFSAVELTEAFLAAIDASNGNLNAYIAVTGEAAVARAKESDARIQQGDVRPLEGLPLGIKDLFSTEGVHTQACSHILDSFKPRYESTVTQNLWDAGAIMLGKLNMDEFAM